MRKAFDSGSWWSSWAVWSMDARRPQHPSHNHVLWITLEKQGSKPQRQNLHGQGILWEVTLTVFTGHLLSLFWIFELIGAAFPCHPLINPWLLTSCVSHRNSSSICGPADVRNYSLSAVVFATYCNKLHFKCVSMGSVMKQDHNFPSLQTSQSNNQGPLLHIHS